MVIFVTSCLTKYRLYLMAPSLATPIHFVIPSPDQESTDLSKLNKNEDSGSSPE